jgi:hypothetical protein
VLGARGVDEQSEKNESEGYARHSLFILTWIKVWTLDSRCTNGRGEGSAYLRE